MIGTVLFDMDGTLLPMDQNCFTRAYFKLLAARLAPRGYESKAFVDGVWAGVAAMTENDGSRTNAEAFWQRFRAIFGEFVDRDMPVFEEFYRTEFNEAQSACGYTPMAAEVVSMLKARGVRLVLASNPVFPLVAQENRMRWAGVSPRDFAYITSYENSHFCKPNPEYYREIADVLHLEPWECLMVGNDVREDMAAREVGMEVFLLTDCLIDPDGSDLSVYPHGGYGELKSFLTRNLG